MAILTQSTRIPFLITILILEAPVFLPLILAPTRKELVTLGPSQLPEQVIYKMPKITAGYKVGVVLGRKGVIYACLINYNITF